MKRAQGSARGIRVTAIDHPDDEQLSAALLATAARFRGSHRPEVGRAFESAFESYKSDPLLVSFSDGSRALVPMVKVARTIPGLSMAMAMPLSLEGTPVSIDGEFESDHLVALFGALDDCGQLELSGGAGASPPVAGEHSRQATHTLDLTPGFDALWNSSFSGKNRNMCRKAERAGASISCENNAGAVAEYHAIYGRASAEWGYATPPYPRALFEGFVLSGAAELWIARLDGVSIAGALMLRGSHDLLYWSGAMDRAHRAAAPSNALIRAAIESACERGLSFFDFGASGPLSGVQSFKESFGATEQPYTSVTLTTRRFRMLSATIAVARRGPASAVAAT